MPCFQLKQRFMQGLLQGLKTNEGRMFTIGTPQGKTILNVSSGSLVAYQNWTTILWWRVMHRSLHECASHMLLSHGYRCFIPDAQSFVEALSVYYKIDTGTEEWSHQKVWEWDEGIREQENKGYASWMGVVERIKIVTRVSVSCFPFIKTDMNICTSLRNANPWSLRHRSTKYRPCRETRTY